MTTSIRMLAILINFIALPFMFTFIDFILEYVAKRFEISLFTVDSLSTLKIIGIGFALCSLLYILYGIVSLLFYKTKHTYSVGIISAVVFSVFCIYGRWALGSTAILIAAISTSFLLPFSEKFITKQLARLLI